MLGCVILNYNDSKTVLSLYNKIKNYKIIDYIIIVDNNSQDNSYEILKKISDKKTIVLKTDKNGGYGYGNNYGIKYCSKLNLKYCLISNPDVEFSEQTIVNCLNLMKEKNAAAVAPKINVREPAFIYKNQYIDIFTDSMILNKIFKPRYYKKELFGNKDDIQVFALPGSLVLFDTKKIIDVGMYDENVFLYNEEVIIGKKLEKKGYKSFLNLKDVYYHYHSVTVRKNYKSMLKPKKICFKSHRYFLKEYCKTNGINLLLHYIIVFPLMYFECLVYPYIRKLFKKGK